MSVALNESMDPTATTSLELRASIAPPEGAARGSRTLRLTAEDGTPIHGTVFAAPDPTAGLVLVHGLQSHARWFEASGTGRDLASAGITCLAYDRRGSGRSGGARGHADSAGEFLSDLDAASVALRGELGAALPMHALANCFGARTLLAYAGAHPDTFQSLILLSPATHMNRRASYGLRSRLRIALASPRTPFPTPLHDEDFVSGDPWLAWIRRDPRALRTVTAGFLRSANALDRKMWRAIDQLRIPLLIVLSRRDVLVDNRAIRSMFAERYRGPLHVLELDSDHYVDFSSARPALVRAIDAWLARTPP